MFVVRRFAPRPGEIEAASTYVDLRDAAWPWQQALAEHSVEGGEVWLFDSELLWRDHDRRIHGAEPPETWTANHGICLVDGYLPDDTDASCAAGRTERGGQLETPGEIRGFRWAGGQTARRGGPSLRSGSRRAARIAPLPSAGAARADRTGESASVTHARRLALSDWTARLRPASAGRYSRSSLAARAAMRFNSMSPFCALRSLRCATGASLRCP